MQFDPLSRPPIGNSRVTSQRVYRSLSGSPRAELHAEPVTVLIETISQVLLRDLETEAPMPICVLAIGERRHPHSHADGAPVEMDTGALDGHSLLIQDRSRDHNSRNQPDDPRSLLLAPVNVILIVRGQSPAIDAHPAPGVRNAHKGENALLAALGFVVSARSIPGGALHVKVQTRDRAAGDRVNHLAAGIHPLSSWSFILHRRNWHCEDHREQRQYGIPGEVCPHYLLSIALRFCGRSARIPLRAHTHNSRIVFANRNPPHCQA